MFLVDRRSAMSRRVRLIGGRDLKAIAFVFTCRLTIRWAKYQNLLKKRSESIHKYSLFTYSIYLVAIYQENSKFKL